MPVKDLNAVIAEELNQSARKPKPIFSGDTETPLVSEAVAAVFSIKGARVKYSKSFENNGIVATITDPQGKAYYLKKL